MIDRVVVAAAATALLIAACGGSDGSAADADAPVASSGAGYCDIVVAGALDHLDVDTTDRAAVEAEFDGLVSRHDRASVAAPHEIATDVALMDGFIHEFADAAAAADYSILDIDPGVSADDYDELVAAHDRIVAYNVRECGVDEPMEGSGLLEFDPEGGTARQQLKAQYQAIGFDPDEASCIAEHIEIAPPGSSEDDQEAAFLDILGTCRIDQERLDELGLGS